MARLGTAIDPASDGFRANRAHMERLVADLRVELARADTHTPFFLLLDDPWYKELQAIVVRM